MSGRRRNTNMTMVLRLAVADLLHERILSLCIVLALGAIISPLLVVLGLKEGIIEHLRSDLIEDPVNREIRPKVTMDLEQAWFGQKVQRGAPVLKFFDTTDVTIGGVSGHDALQVIYLVFVDQAPGVRRGLDEHVVAG